jgi:hypothetical protein
VVKIPQVNDMYFTSLSHEAMPSMDNMRPGRALKWKAEDHWLGRSGSEVWKADTSKVVAPPVSIKD